MLGLQERQARDRRAAAAAVQRAEEAKLFAELLATVFDDDEHPPDAEFGAFAVVLGEQGTPHEDVGLLRAWIGAAAACSAGSQIPCCMRRAARIN